MRRRRFIARGARAAGAMWLWPLAAVPRAGAPGRGVDVLVMSNGATTPAWLKLVPVVEQATGHRMVTVVTAMGTGSNAIPSRVRRGEPADVVLLPSATVDDLIRDGHALAGSRVDFARSRIGLATPSGAARPAIATVTELKEALLATPSIAVSAQVSGQYVISELFPTLGIAAQVAAKLRRVEGELVADVLARRDAAVGFQQISELIAAPGVDYVGPLPAELQRVTVMAAGIPKSAPQPDAAREVIRVLASSRATAILEASGLDPIVGP